MYYVRLLNVLIFLPGVFLQSSHVRISRASSETKQRLGEWREGFLQRFVLLVALSIILKYKLLTPFSSFFSQGKIKQHKMISPIMIDNQIVSSFLL